jgi:hypothetical protein
MDAGLLKTTFMRSELFIGESPCVHYRKRNAIFTAHSLRSFKTRSAQRILSFSFTVERTVNENHPKLRFIWFVSQDTSPSIESMIRWVLDTVGLLNYSARRAWVYFFSPSHKKLPLRPLRLERSGRCYLRNTCNPFCTPFSV